MKQKGLTLIEVLVAMAVFGYAAITLMATTSQNVRSHDMLYKNAVANWIAQNQMAEYILRYDNGGKVSGSFLNGEVEMAEQTWYYSIKDVGEANQWLRAVEVSVSEDEDGENTLATVNGFVEKR